MLLLWLKHLHLRQLLRRELLKPHSSKPADIVPAGKLSAKHSTKHIARNPIPIGGINEKGQAKIQDKQGKIRFIDMKQGRVLSPEGVPVKPQKTEYEKS
jgi:hypothetical protein